jgi:xanthine dehydrogenase accessory factor
MSLVLIRGAGDLASGVALRLRRTGLRVVMCELPEPLAVRRLVSFSEAIYDGECSVEGVSSRRVNDPTDTLRILQLLAKGTLPVLVDPQGAAVKALHPTVVVDGRMQKIPAALDPTPVPLLIGLGPGFTAGENCHAVVETNRGHYLGRVLWQGSAQADTGIPEGVGEHDADRVLRAPVDGTLRAHAGIGEVLQTGQVIAELQPADGSAMLSYTAAFPGVLRGLLRDGSPVQAGMKFGDLDPRCDPAYARLVSDKSLAIGGGVLEAILSRPELRKQLWS